MIRVFSCIIEQHDAWLAVLAGALCIASFGVAAALLHHIDVTRPQQRTLWLIGVGVVAGGGSWATHFVAMLGYEPGFPLNFLPGPTLLSAIFGVAGAAAAYLVSDRDRNLRGAALAGGLMATGIIGLHFTGMLGIDAAFRAWDTTTVALAGALCTLGCVIAMSIGRNAVRLRRRMASSGVVVLSVLSLHFIAMGALTLLPVSAAGSRSGNLNIEELALLIAVAVAAVLLVVATMALAESRVSAAKWADLAAQRRAQIAEAQNVAKSQFLAVMSHELRTPLNSISAYAELIREIASDEGRPAEAADAEAIIDASRQLLMLVSEVLDFSKVDAGKATYELESFGVTRLIEEIVTATLPLAQKNGNRLEVDIARETGEIVSDRQRVRQCVLNLLSNAAKFTQAGIVRLSVRPEMRHGRPGLMIAVADTGIGMPESALATVFEPFRQADQSIERRFGGTGLGLSITKGLIEGLGGSIAASSTHGAGSTFTLWVPSSEALAASREFPGLEAV